MKSKETKKLNFILSELERFYPRPEVSLIHNDVFTLLIAVMLSAHTTDASVNKVAPKLFAIGGDPKSLANLPLEEISDIIRPVGCHNVKAKYLKHTAKIIAEQFNSVVPKDMKELEKLPGVGHKTASVVVSQGFGGRAFPVDTHIKRLAARWGISSHRDIRKVEDDLKEFFPEERWRDVHLQMIFYGREYCKARGHDANICPICQGLKIFT